MNLVFEASPFKDLCDHVVKNTLPLSEFSWDSKRHAFLCDYYSDYVRVITPFIATKYFTDIIVDEPSYLFFLFSYTGKVIGMFLRSVDENVKFVKYLISDFYSEYFLFSFWSDWGNKKFSDPVIVVEGIMDALVVRLFYPYVVALMNVRPNKDKLTIMTSLSNTFYLMLDNDEAGNEGINKLFKSFSDRGAFVNKIPYGLSDPGSYVTDLNALKSILLGYGL